MIILLDRTSNTRILIEFRVHFIFVADFSLVICYDIIYLIDFGLIIGGFDSLADRTSWVRDRHIGIAHINTLLFLFNANSCTLWQVIGQRTKGGRIKLIYLSIWDLFGLGHVVCQNVARHWALCVEFGGVAVGGVFCLRPFKWDHVCSASKLVVRSLLLLDYNILAKLRTFIIWWSSA